MKPLSPFPRLPCALAFAAITAAAPAPTHADDWEKIASDHGHTAEINSSVMFDSDHGAKVAWGRIVLDDTEAKRAGYRSVRVLNRFDCPDRSLTTFKRIYLGNDNKILREDIVRDPQPVTIRGNSADERAWRKVCGVSPPSASVKRGKKTAPHGIDQLADTANRAARTALQPAKGDHQQPRAVADQNR
jgi:carbonic anhydrase